ncbi:hypothetical protein [Mesorhizobium sp. RMAD-H1]|uniref:hypothetical protein n=1 Tax=Mesorhizobium sp. RMAD-H1 TaxID=2587065 RepID=UPI001621735E|nr:hypothetical protein [Mesorhizobium sp. RMAD-H1]MBB2973965.1 hypothetical protein [Mesorhizobium sp. RMAD-H1]
MTRTLTRQHIRLRETLSPVEAHVCDGLAIVARDLPDEAATAEAMQRWLDGDRSDEPPGQLIRRGFALAHASSGYLLTPAGWLLPDFDAARRCVRLLLDRFGGMFGRDVRSIQTLGSAVIEAHRQCDAWTGRHDQIRRLGASINEAEYQRRLAALRAQRPLDARDHQGLEAAE